MKALQQYLVVGWMLVLAPGVLWAVGPYLNAFSSDTFLSDRAFEELAVESKQRFGHRFVVGPAVGAGVTLLWILYDLAAAWKRRANRREN